MAPGTRNVAPRTTNAALSRMTAVAVCDHRRGDYRHRDPPYSGGRGTQAGTALDTLPLCRHFGCTIVPTYSVVMAHVNDSVEKGEFAAAPGGLLIVQGAGAVVGPLIAGVAMSFL